MKPTKVFRPVDADSHHFNEDKDLDPDPYISEKSDSKLHSSPKMVPDSHESVADP